MATGRTVNRFVRFYADGYDLSGYGRTVGPLSVVFDEADLTAPMSDAIKGYLPNQPNITPGVLNGIFDNTATSGLHVVASAITSSRIVMIPIGIRAAPAAGDPVFMGQFVQSGYQASEDGGAVVATVPFGMWEVTGLVNYTQPWGRLLHAKSAATAANTGTADHDNGGATAAGGYLCYQVFAGNGTATISIDDAAVNTNPSFSALSGATSGSIDCSSVQKGIVALGVTAAVRQYLRWQIALGTASTVTFALSFVRG